VKAIPLTAIECSYE